jgi:hypothetical protein
MNGPSSLVIHEVLPSEIMAMLFEDHAELEWRAPVIDCRVCRIWRQIVLNTPRAWSHVEIGVRKRPRAEDLGSWLHRSGSAPLHIRVDFPLDGSNGQKLYDLLSTYRSRMVSLRMVLGDPSFFGGQEFPLLRLLAVEHWSVADYPPHRFRLGPMPELQSLRIGRLNWSVGDIGPLKVAILYRTNCISFPRHSQSLTTLMLDEVSLGDAISSPVDFPSLTYLSLFYVSGLKPYINAPSLVTYHEGGNITDETFPIRLPSLLEYGATRIKTCHPDLTTWHNSFPNILRLLIKGLPPVLISFLRNLSDHPHLLPELQTISVLSMDPKFTEAQKEIMERLVRDRSEACHLCIDPHIEKGVLHYIPVRCGALSYL